MAKKVKDPSAQRAVERLAALLVDAKDGDVLLGAVSAHLDFWENPTGRVKGPCVDPDAAARGRLGGLTNKGKDGIAKGLSMADPKRRREIALMGVAKRLSNKKQK